MSFDPNDTDKSSLYDKNYIYRKIDEFICSKAFIRKKLKNGKLFCDICGSLFPANLPLFVKIDEINEKILCVPCENKILGINQEEINKSERAKVGVVPIVKREYKRKENEKNAKSKNQNQASLF